MLEKSYQDRDEDIKGLALLKYQIESMTPQIREDKNKIFSVEFDSV